MMKILYFKYKKTIETKIKSIIYFKNLVGKRLSEKKHFYYKTLNDPNIINPLRLPSIISLVINLKPINLY